MKIGNTFFLIILLFIGSTAIHALKVDVEELNTGRTVRFINNQGPHTRVYTAQERKDIGKNLAYQSEKDNLIYTYGRWYSILHAVDTNQTGLLDADLFFILKGAEIDHIIAVQTILAAYLEARYQYSAGDSMLLARFASFYNAIYRGDTGYFRSKYKAGVMKHLNPRIAGISTKYYEWPGKTAMLVPLTEDLLKGNPAALDTSELSSSNVIESLRKKEDKGIADRKGMIELQKNEITNQKQAIEEKKKEVSRAKEEIEQAEMGLDKKKEAAENKKQEVNRQEESVQKQKEAVQKAAAPIEKKKEQENLDNQQKKLEQSKKDLNQASGEVKKQEESLNQKKAEVKKEETAVKQAEKQVQTKEEKVKKDEELLKKDEASQKIDKNPARAKEELNQKSDTLNEKEKELDLRENELKKNKPGDNIYGGKLYYLKIKQYIPDGHYSNEMVLINPSTKKVELVSPFKTIGGHKFDIYEDGVVVIGYEPGTGKGKIARRTDNQDMVVGYTGPAPEDYILVLLDGKTLEYKAKGKDTVFWRSFVEIRDGFIYAVVNEDGKYYLAKFDDKLSKSAQSADEIDENSFISFYGDTVFINAKDKSILALKKNDLTLDEKITP